MITDIKSAVQLLIFVLFLTAIGYAFSQAVPAISQLVTLPAKLQADTQRLENQRQLDNAKIGAEIIAVPTMVALQVKATEQAIQNEKTKADSQANAQVLQAQGQAEFQRSLGQSVFNFVVVLGVGVFTFLGLRFAWGLVALRQLKEHARLHGGGVSVLPGGAMSYIESRRREQLEPSQDVTVPVSNARYSHARSRGDPHSEL